MLNCGGGSAKVQDCVGSVVRSMECSGSVRLLKCCCGVAGLRRHGMIVGAWRRVIAEMLLRVGVISAMRQRGMFDELLRCGRIDGAWRRVIAEMLLRVGDGAGLRGVAWLTERGGMVAYF